MYGDYGKTDGIYRQMLSYIEENGLEIIGNAYEEYLLDELAESDPESFVMQVMIQVGPKKATVNSPP